MLTRKALGNAAIAEDAVKAVAVVAVTTTVEAAAVAVTTTTLVAVATEAVATATTAVAVAAVVAAAVVAVAAVVVEKVKVTVTTTTEAAEVEVRTGIIEMIKSETTIKAIRLRTGAATIAVLTSARGLMVRALVKASSLFAMDAVSSDANARKTVVEGVEKWAPRGLRSTMKTTNMKISTSTKAHTAMNSVETADALSSKEDTPRRAVHCCSSTLVRTLSC